MEVFRPDARIELPQSGLLKQEKRHTTVNSTKAELLKFTA
jgi:hypothetical protein